MKLLQLAAIASAVLAAPTRRAITDTDILQFALTLEHLENVFYDQALSKFTEKDFCDAGYSSKYYNDVKYIARDEASHVQALTAAIAEAGAHPEAACTYNFPITDVHSFVTLSSVLEGVGTSAYVGAAPLIQSKEYLAVAGAILITEALHTSLQRFKINEVPFANPYGTALGINEVYTLAAAFITSCPKSNTPLPVMKFPTLTATSSSPYKAGNTVTFKKPTAQCSGQLYVTFISGLAITSVPAKLSNNMISSTVPDTAMGQTYAVLTNSNVTSSLNDNMVIAGPAILEVIPPAPTY